MLGPRTHLRTVFFLVALPLACGGDAKDAAKVDYVNAICDHLAACNGETRENYFCDFDADTVFYDCGHPDIMPECVAGIAVLPCYIDPVSGQYVPANLPPVCAEALACD